MGVGVVETLIINQLCYTDERNLDNMKDILLYVGFAIYMSILIIAYFWKIKEPKERQVILVNPIKRRPDSQRYLTLSKLIRKDIPNPINKESSNDVSKTKTNPSD